MCTTHTTHTTHHHFKERINTVAVNIEKVTAKKPSCSTIGDNTKLLESIARRLRCHQDKYHVALVEEIKKIRVNRNEAPSQSCKTRRTTEAEHKRNAIIEF